MRKNVLAIRHVHFEDLGAFEAPLEKAGYEICYSDAGLDDLASLKQPDLLAVLGGPIGACEENEYPFLNQELALLSAQLDAGKPVLGICLGAQLIARAMGARVYPGRAKEIGWKPLTLTSEGEQVLGALQGIPVLHWHGDTFDLPNGAVNLAFTDICDHQAFRAGRNALAFQFHPEAQQKGFERWLIGHTAEVSATPGISVPQLRSDTERYAELSTNRCRAMFESWLGQIE